MSFFPSTAARSPIPPLRVFLTGASSGIGAAIAERLVREGCRVWGTTRHKESLPPDCPWHAVEVDLGDPEAIELAWQQAEKESGGLDVLINNAGSAVFGPAEATPDALRRLQWEILFHAPVSLTLLALPRMRERGLGTILNITSLAGQFPIPYMATYNAAKAALSAWTASVRLEIEGGPIRMIDIQPGDIRTPFCSHTMLVGRNGHSPEGATWKVVQQHAANSPEPSKVADRVVRLLESSKPPPASAVGSWFQEGFLPLGRCLGPRFRELWIRHFYRLRSPSS